ncbi:uncharacterized protein LOC113341356 [Papaver somniferum]|uniref:uncharacterized protein LOC113341356 n=1 Tax=Papaver somniferum TaxID=3469 RepID=UPI000E6FFDD9|nr:uncharacterized protein LOC113341356 [Papaver somniferum]
MLSELRNHIESIDKRYEWDDWSFGFGYVSATNEYKVVGIYVSDSGYLEVCIYTVGTKRWRDLGRKFNLEFRPRYNDEPGSFANGAIYWIGNEVQKIVTFDLIQEKFCEHLAPPPLPPNRNLINQTIGLLDGVLYIAFYAEDGCYDIWLLKKKNDNHDTKGDKHQSFEWSKELRVADNGLLVVTKTGDVLTKAPTSERVWDSKEEVVLQVFPRKNTFLSLKDSGEEQTKKLKSVKGGRKP